MNDNIIIYGKNSAGTITPITLQGTGQNLAITYLEQIETAEDRGTKPSPRQTSEILCWNNSTLKWDSRRRDYVMISMSGALLAAAANTLYQLAVASGTSDAWTSVTQRTSSITSGITWSGTTISGLSSSKLYLVQGNLGLSSVNIGTADTVIGFSLATGGSQLVRSELAFNSDSSFGGGLNFSYLLSGNTSLQFRIISNAALGTPFSGTSNPCMTFSCSIVEL
jgi:hypothetical protein